MSNIPRKEYPRPQFVRENWMNLNGTWAFEIDNGRSGEARGLQKVGTALSGEITVPFCPESELSGVQHTDFMYGVWYKRTVTVTEKQLKGRAVLHFGAVDYCAKVFVNGELAGTHKGGYVSFEFDVTALLKAGENEIAVYAEDNTRDRLIPSGKQSEQYNSYGCFYTRTTGIWQTVWLEPVASSHITSIKAIPNIDNGVMSVTVGACSDSPVSDIVEVSLLDKGQVVATAKGVQGTELRLAVQNPTLWEPSNPYLYDMKVSLSKNGKKVDEVKSYTAFRKISAERDANGIMRMRLNNKNLFQYGPLDQGWWPDGLYTAPTDEALLYDIVKTKAWGFNVIRKHVKVEPARWYYHCDKEGMLVWQDMPSGDMGNQWAPHTYNGGTDKERTEESIRNYYKEWKEIMDLCVSNPSVVVWVPFNEAWGQFDTEKAAEWTKTYDPSRLVNPASGGNFRACGDILDLHNYG